MINNLTDIWNGFERRKFPRKPVVANARIRRINPNLPTIMNVYTRDLTSRGACFTVTDSIAWKTNDVMQITFVTPVHPTNLIKIHTIKARVAWARNGRVGVEFEKPQVK